jgi:MerR family transcriptional regulator, copper efflux regulator
MIETQHAHVSPFALDLRVGSKVYRRLMTTYRISQLAERTGVPASTLRYYESEGLLPAQRSPAGYRLYEEPAVERLGFIATAKRLGLPLDEIAELLHVWEAGACVEVKTDLRPRLQSRLTEAEQRHDEAARFVASLRAALDHLDALPDRSEPCDPNCGFLSLTERAPQPQRWRDAPIACSLTRDETRDRGDQWRDLVADATREPVADGIELTVPIDRLAAVADLAAAEQACCPFLDFRLHLDGPDLHVRVRTSSAGWAMLTALFDAPAD